MVSSKTPLSIIKQDLALVKMPKLSLYLSVKDKVTKQPIPNVILVLTNKKSKKQEKIQMTEFGEYLNPLINNKVGDVLDLSFKFDSLGYLTQTSDLKLNLDKDGRYDVTKFLDINLTKVKAGETKIKDIVKINAFYFDLDKSIIRPDAAKELDKFVEVMNNNPQMMVELGSHINCRSSAENNLDLSSKRARASAKYIAIHISDPS